MVFFHFLVGFLSLWGSYFQDLSKALGPHNLMKDKIAT